MRSYDHPNILRLEQMTYKEVRELPRDRTVLIATVSPLEVHGDHLPLGQDMFEGEQVAKETMLRLFNEGLDWKAVFIQPIPVACDTVPGVGSVEFSPSMVTKVAYTLMEPFAKDGFTRMAFASFHGSPRHTVALERACARLQDTYANAAAVSLFSVGINGIGKKGFAFLHEAAEGSPGYDLDEKRIYHDQHGGVVETSLALHLFPELVNEVYKELPASHPEFLAGSSLFGDDATGVAATIEKTRRFLADVKESLMHYTRSTYRGFPAMASEECGESLFDAIVNLSLDGMRQFLKEGRNFNGHSPLWAKRHILLNEALGGAIRGIQAKKAANRVD